MIYPLHELLSLLKQDIENNFYLQKKGKKPIAISVEGAPGIGKTLSIEALGETINKELQEKYKSTEIQYQVVTKSVAQIAEEGDLLGYPIVEIEYSTTTGEKVWQQKDIPTTLVPTGRTRQSYALPEWYQNLDLSKPGMLILDDYNRASSNSMLNAMMELIYRQKTEAWSLPEGWTIITTSNENDGTNSVKYVDKAQQGRQKKYKVKFDLDTWLLWAEENGMHETLISFFTLNKEILSPETGLSARDITLALDSVAQLVDSGLEKNLDQICKSIVGTLGEPFVILLKAFIKDKLHLLPSIKEILNSDNCLSKIEEVVLVQGNLQLGRSLYLMQRLEAYAKLNYRSKVFSGKEKENVRLLLTCDLLPESHRLTASQKLLNINTRMNTVFSGTNILTKLIV